MSKKNRINKWRSYREEIDSNESIHFSIVNSDKELQKLFKLIDFDIQKAYKKAGYFSKKNDSLFLNNSAIEKKEIEQILDIIEMNENPKTKNKIIKDFNSHKNDSIINEHFLEFVDRDDLMQQSEQETTNLKINKINIVEKGK